MNKMVLVAVAPIANSNIFISYKNLVISDKLNNEPQYYKNRSISEVISEMLIVNWLMQSIFTLLITYNK